MQTSTMKACFQIAECSLAYAKIRLLFLLSKKILFFFALKQIYSLGKVEKYAHTWLWCKPSIDDVIDDHSCDCHAESGGDVAERTVDLRLC